MKWDDMLSRVLPSLPGCPDTLALEHLIDAARTFASKTLVWQYEPPVIKTVANVADYTLQIPADEELVRLLLVEVDGAEYSTADRVSGRAAIRRGCVSNIAVMNGPRDFSLTPTPVMDDRDIVTEVAVKPALLGSEKWPDDLDEHVPDIVHGALATLLEMPNTDWRDIVEADRRQARFQERIGSAAARVSLGYGRGRRARRALEFY